MASQFLRELHFIEAEKAASTSAKTGSRSSFGNCTSLRQGHQRHVRGHLESQFLRELHFIEAGVHGHRSAPGSCRSSFGNCTSLRHLSHREGKGSPTSQFLRELHFIEAWCPLRRRPIGNTSQFLRELHFIEAVWVISNTAPTAGRSSFGNCTSLRRRPGHLGSRERPVAVPSGTALH